MRERSTVEGRGSRVQFSTDGPADSGPSGGRSGRRGYVIFVLVIHDINILTCRVKRFEPLEPFEPLERFPIRSHLLHNQAVPYKQKQVTERGEHDTIDESSYGSGSDGGIYFFPVNCCRTR